MPAARFENPKPTALPIGMKTKNPELNQVNIKKASDYGRVQSF
jgi:hypothetical protein